MMAQYDELGMHQFLAQSDTMEDESSDDIVELLGQLGVEELKAIEDFVKNGEFH